MDKITLSGAILLALVGILPGICSRVQITGLFFGGTSLLIMVGVIFEIPAANRNPVTDASVRRFDEKRKDPGASGRDFLSNLIAKLYDSLTRQSRNFARFIFLPAFNTVHT